jgi:DNA phosphorothioation-associated putative methyltransferase
MLLTGGTDSLLTLPLAKNRMKNSAGSAISTVSPERARALSTLCSEVLKAPEGKLTRSDKYVHRSVLDQTRYDGLNIRILDQIWKLSTPGNLDWNVLRTLKTGSHMSVLSYPHFETTGHPELELSLKVDLRSGQLVVTDYRGRENRPILHRKEALVADDYTLKNRFRALTQQEEELGLLLEAHKIGLAKQWQSRLLTHGVEVRGHWIIRSVGELDSNDA